MQQSTHIVCDGLASLKLEKKLFITINMTTIARRFDDGVQKWGNVNKTMGTAQPARRIRRCRCQVDARIGVGFRGCQGWKGGKGEPAMYFWADSSCSWGHGVFFSDKMWLVQCLISLTKCMVQPPCEYLCRLIRGRGTRWWCQNWPGWSMGGCY